MKTDPVSVLGHIQALRSILEALVEVDEKFLEEHERKSGVPHPSVHDVGAVLRLEPSSDETFRDIPSIVALGAGDVADIACWRIAELRLRGKDASPMIEYRRGGGYTVKVRIDDEDGVVHIEDPVDIVGRR